MKQLLLCAAIVLGLALGRPFIMSEPSVATPPTSEAVAVHGAVQCGGHGQKACLAVVSPYVRNAVRNGHVTWCLNARASNYPGFRQQLHETMDLWAAADGYTHSEVPYPADVRDASCNVRHDMPANHACGGCSAWVYTQNWPVTVEYKWQLGYVYWYSTIGHEYGHAGCLLDEHYDKVGFRSYILTFGRWLVAPTSMDVGTPFLPEYAPRGIYGPTPYDTARCKETIHPRPIEGWGLRYHPDGTPYVFACNLDNVRGPADRLAVMVIAPWGEWFWSGHHLPAPGNCASQPVGMNIVPGPGWCFALNPEISTMPSTWETHRQDRIVGCT